MPRQIDLFPQNLQVTNDPNNQISVTAAQINNLNDQIPAAIAAAEAAFLNSVLTAIDQATGLDLVDWLADAQAFFNSISASLQQSWLNLQNFLNGLAQTADADVTLALQWLQGQFNQLQALLQQSWLSFQNLLNGIIQEADADVAAVVAYLNDVGESATKAWTQIEDFITTGDWSDLTTAWNDLMLGIFGSSTSLGLVGLIPAPAVVNVTQNLQPVWDFPDSASVSAAGQWSWDGSQDHTGVTGSGSAKYACNGALGALRGIPGAVSPSQTVTPSAWVMWSGLTASSGTSPIQLELIPYSGAGSSLFAGTPVTIASVTSPGSSHAWEELTGTYTVPSSGVTAVQLRLVVTADATAGSIWWDDCQADLSGGFLADLQSDTNDIINSFAPGGTVGEFQTGVTNLLALFGLTPADVGGATVIDTVWTDVINDIINPLNALEISAINGLATALSALLGTTTFQTLIDSVANALGHSGTGHTITNIETYLGLIPPTNVTNVLGGANLGADVSSVNTAVSAVQTDFTDIVNSFAPGGTVTQFVTGVQNLLAILGLTSSSVGSATNLTTIWTAIVNDIINPLNAIETQAVNIVGDIEQSAVDGLTDVWDWLTGSSTPPTSSSVTQVQAGAVPAVGNQANLLDAVQAGWDALVQAFTGTTDTGHSLGGLANAASTTATTASNAQTVAQAATMVQAQQTAAKAAYAAFGDVTADVTFEVGPTYNLASMPTISVTAASSAIGYIVTPDNVNKLSVLFVAETVGTVTGVYINVYSVGAAGLCTNVIAGSNIVSEIGTLEAVIYDDFASALTVTPGSQWAIEAVVTGSGSLAMMGLGPSWAPTNSVVPLGTSGGTRTSTPTHNAAGAGSFTTASSTTFSWSHTLSSSATGILIEFVANGAVSSVKVGGVTATLLGSKVIASSITAYVYGLLSPPTGTQTVLVTLTTSTSLNGNSDSYIGVSSFGTAATNSGAGTTASVVVSSASGQTAVAAMFDDSGGALSAFNQTSRWNTGSSFYAGVFGDAAGASTITFQATSPGPWAAIGVSLVGSATPTPPGTFTPTATTSIPLFGMSANGGTSTPVFAPETANYTTHGTYTFTLPTWFKAGVDFLDAILLGPGGGGGGGIGDAGSSGGTTSVTVGGTTITAASGSGAAAGNTNAAGAVGASPGNQTYQSTTYYGGSASSYSYGLVTVGSSPGGGGAGGGTSGTYGFGGHSGAWTTHTFNPTGTTVSVTVGAGGSGSPFFGAEDGADGAVWLVARQA